MAIVQRRRALVNVVAHGAITVGVDVAGGAGANEAARGVDAGGGDSAIIQRRRALVPTKLLPYGGDDGSVVQQ